MNELIEELETLASYYGNDFEGKETKEHKTLTTAIDVIRRYEEMMEKAGRIELNGDGSLHGVIERDWDFDSRSWWVDTGQRGQLRRLFDSPLDAFDAIQQEDQCNKQSTN